MSAPAAPAASVGRVPTDGERAFAWFFAIVYVTVIAIVAVVVATVVVRYLFKDAPQFAPWLLGLLVFGMIPHAAKIAAESVARTRGKDVWTRFVDIVSSM
ncbi:MAG: hypothetical protein ACREUU_05775 [Gammaproteobacteria bacterium]